jgi:hypothetical protein
MLFAAGGYGNLHEKTGHFSVGKRQNDEWSDEGKCIKKFKILRKIGGKRRFYDHEKKTGVFRAKIFW